MPIKYAIITPTYKEHFKYIENYLKSFYKFVEDKFSIPIYFIISNSELKLFNKMFSKYMQKLDINILFIENLLKENNVTISPEEYLNKYGRFTFQTAKKYFAMLHVDAEKFLVLDSESQWIRKTNMTNLFKEYFENPFIVISDIDLKTRQNQFISLVLNNISNILNCDITNKWFIEHFDWFYEKRILLDLFNHYGSLNEMISKLYTKNQKLEICTDDKYCILEILLYYAFLYINLEEYNYKLINISEIMNKIFKGVEYNEYYQTFLEKYKGGCGIFEHSLSLINKSNYKQIFEVLKESKLNIIRIEETTLNNIPYQKFIIDSIKPNILAASQNHIFGVNSYYRELIIHNCKYEKFMKHKELFINAIKTFADELPSVMWYFVLWLIQNIVCIFKLIKELRNAKKIK